MRIIFLLVIFSLLSLDGFSQTKDEIVKAINRLPVSPNSIYIFCRGTKSKAGFVARNFNLKDTNITHIGLGYVERSSFRIFNVSDTKGNGNVLVIDSVSSFIESDDVFYFSIWKYETSVKKLQTIKRAIKNYENGKVIFDFSFQLKEDDTLYCSEFCAAVLNSIYPRSHSFKPVRKELNDPLYRAVLKRKELIFYPVDFFQVKKEFSIVCEFRIE